jgi:hypothetical protein
MRLVLLPIVLNLAAGCAGGGEAPAPLGEAVVVEPAENEPQSAIEAGAVDLDRQGGNSEEDRLAHEEATGSAEAPDLSRVGNQPDEVSEHRPSDRRRAAEQPSLELEPLEETTADAIDALRVAPSTGTARASELMREMDEQLEAEDEQDDLFGSEPGEGEVDPLFGD